MRLRGRSTPLRSEPLGLPANREAVPSGPPGAPSALRWRPSGSPLQPSGARNAQPGSADPPSESLGGPSRSAFLPSQTLPRPSRRALLRPGRRALGGMGPPGGTRGRWRATSGRFPTTRAASEQRTGAGPTSRGQGRAYPGRRALSVSTGPPSLANSARIRPTSS